MRFFLLLFLFSTVAPIVPARADCATNLHGTKPEGYIFYNVDHQVFQGCQGDRWVDLRALRFEEEDDADSGGCAGPADCPQVGDVCADGYVFAGCGGADSHPFFTTRCDAGRTWGGSSCGGSRQERLWAASGSGSLRATGVTSLSDGRANTLALTEAPGGGACQANQPCDSRTAAGVQNHPAAQYCANLNIHNRSDWYLPAHAELYAIGLNHAAFSDFLTNQPYWSSTELNNQYPYAVQQNNHYLYLYDFSKDDEEKYIRCVRRDD